jgi:anti-sigma factor RsiW
MDTNRDEDTLSALIRANAQHFAAPAALRARVRAAGKPRRDFSTFLSFFSGWRMAVPSFALAAAVLWSVGVVSWPMHSDERMMQAAINSYVRATAAHRLVDVASSNREAIQPWVSDRLGFSAPVVSTVPAQGELVGARMDSLDGRAVAAIVYRVRDHIVNTYVWPATDDSATIASASLKGFNVSHWSRGGLRYCVVSDLPHAQVVAFAETLARHGEQEDEQPR